MKSALICGHEKSSASNLTATATWEWMLFYLHDYKSKLYLAFLSVSEGVGKKTCLSMVNTEVHVYATPGYNIQLGAQLHIGLLCEANREDRGRLCP